MKIFFTKSLSISFFFFGVFLPWQKVYGQSSPSGLTLSPAFQEVVLEEGEKQKDFSVSLMNNTDVPVVLHVTPLDFGSLDESGGVAFLGTSGDLEKKYALASWLQLEKDTISVEPYSQSDVHVTVENRENLAPGGHYGALTFKTEYTGQRSAGDSVSVNQLFSTLIFLKKVGGDIARLSLKDSEYDAHLFHFQDVIRLRFEDSGNVHVIPRGTVIVSDPLGRIVAKGIINEESALILPETTRVYAVRLHALDRIFVPGRYTMTLSYRFDGRDDFVVISFLFDFIPPLAMLCLSVLIAICWWYVVRIRRRTGEKKALSKEKEAKPSNT